MIWSKVACSSPDSQAKICNALSFHLIKDPQKAPTLSISIPVADVLVVKPVVVAEGPALAPGQQQVQAGGQ